MDIPYPLRRSQACMNFPERRLADQLDDLRIQTKQKLSEMGDLNIDGKSPDISYSESVKRFRQALSNYVKLEDDSPTQVLLKTAPKISVKPKKLSKGNPYNRTRMYFD